MSIKKNNTYFQEDNGKVYYYDENGERKNVPNSAFGTLKADLESTSGELIDTIETTSGILHDEIETTSGNLQEQINNIGSPLTYSGISSVAEINAITSTKQGTVYTISDSGTITGLNSDIQVNQSDEIAYANGWVKIGKDFLYEDYYKKTETSGKQEIADALNTKQDVATLMNNINIDVGQNNLALNKENAEIQNIHWSTKNWADETIEQDIVISDMPFAWYGYRDTQGQVQTNTIKLTFAHNLDYYESIILSIDVNGSPISRADVDITHVVVNDTIANWYNTVYIRVKELGDNYIVIGQDGQGPTGYIYNLTTTPERISKIIISTNEVSCISNGHSFVGGINSSALNDCNMAFGDSAIASGTGSVAIGEHTLAIGDNARSIGRYSKASGFCTFAEGGQTSAFGQDSHAEGFETVTNSYNNNGGEGAHAEGWRTSAINHAHSEGYETIASANENRGITHAEGYKTSAFIAVTYPFAAAHSEGNCTIASGLDSHAEGRGTSAIGNYSHSEGCGTIAGSERMHAGGKYNKTSSDALFVIGNGTDNEHRSDAFIISADGTVSAKRFIEADPALTITGGDYVSVTEDVQNNKLIIDLDSDLGTMLTSLSGLLSAGALPTTGRHILGVDNGTLTWLEVNQ